MTTKQKKVSKAKHSNAAPDAVEFLESQHREVEALFSEIEKTDESDDEKRVALFEDIAHKLECHAQIEEQLFYPEGKAVDKDTTLEAYEEHGVVRVLIAQIKATAPSDERFMAKVTVLKEAVEHHVEEEESHYFPEVKKALGAERIAALGVELKQRFDELDSAIPLGQEASEAAEVEAAGGAALAKKNMARDTAALLHS